MEVRDLVLERQVHRTVARDVASTTSAVAILVKRAAREKSGDLILVFLA